MKKRVTIVVVLVVAVVAVAAPILLQRRAVALRNQCANQLRQIDSPMSCCVPLANALTNGATLNPKQVAQYIKGNTIPRCPCGPKYEIVWRVGGPPPKCPYHGDLIGPNAEHKH